MDNQKPKKIIGFTLGSKNETRGISIKNNEMNSVANEDQVIGFTAEDGNKVLEKIEIEGNKALETVSQDDKLAEAKDLISKLKNQLTATQQENLQLNQKLTELEQKLAKETISKEELTDIILQLNEIIKNPKVNQTFHIENQTINHHTKNIQGFDIEGSNNTFTSPSVQGNTTETIAYEEETELQTAVEAPPPSKQLEQ
jgi:hypothetical protein